MYNFIIYLIRISIFSKTNLLLNGFKIVIFFRFSFYDKIVRFLRKFFTCISEGGGGHLPLLLKLHIPKWHWHWRESCPPEYDSEVRSEIASSSIRQRRRGGYLKIRREFYRKPVAGRSNERSYLHSAIFFSFFTTLFCSLGIVLPSESRLAPFTLARKECSIMQKCARQSFAARALVPTQGVFKLILTRGRERVANANQQSARC